MRSIQLINAPLAKNFYPSIRAGAYPPLHLASLAAFLRKGFPQVDLQIFDGELSSIEDIISCLHADIIAISCNSLTYDSALRIAKSAKLKGSFVILGGAHPTFVGEAILHNRCFVDAVIYGDGELALANLVDTIRLSSIPNLIYREGEKIITNKSCNIELDDLPFPDYTGIRLEPYFLNYQKLYSDKPFKKVFAAFSAKGCQWRNQTGGCIFCAVQHTGFRIKSVKKYWRELEMLQDNWGADFVWDVSDTFTSQPQWVRTLVDNKPQGINLPYQIYARSSDINKEMVHLLARLGVYEVFLGLDAGSNITLQKSRKGTTVSGNLKAIKNLNREGIKVIISVVIGLPGETEDTLRATRLMTEDILSWGDLSEINCSILLPLPGSHAMNMLKRVAPSQKGREDLFDAEALRKSWVSNFCEVDYAMLMEEQKQIMQLHDRVGSFGVTVIEQANYATGISDIS
ncbi:MAG: B12-binding domain-containing radical SAM protein [Desulfobacteraceae bacterium]|nr:B12-binding domain-containing radical SAM protein [Desulfobacteraceae bacterium]MBU4126759.1 B12-binding domain-containing radical SAM protein [Pseudomonadota bacterium]